jgi:hypothetical protein
MVNTEPKVMTFSFKYCDKRCVTNSKTKMSFLTRHKNNDIKALYYFYFFYKYVHI